MIVILLCLLEDFEEEEVFFWEQLVNSGIDEPGSHIVLLGHDKLIDTDILLDYLKILYKSLLMLKKLLIPALSFI